MLEDDFRHWSLPLWSAATAEGMDRRSYKTFAIHPLVLMETAGRAVGELAMQLNVQEWDIAVLAGPGNNGGDGLVSARFLHDRGVPVVVIMPLTGGFSEACEPQFKTCQAMQIPILPSLAGLDATKPLFVIDALLGIGVQGSLRGCDPNTLWTAG